MLFAKVSARIFALSEADVAQLRLSCFKVGITSALPLGDIKDLQIFNHSLEDVSKLQSFAFVRPSEPRSPYLLEKTFVTVIRIIFERSLHITHCDPRSVLFCVWYGPLKP